MKYILDTNMVSRLMRGEPAVSERLLRLKRPDVAVPEPVFAEIAYGIARMKRSAKKARLEALLETFRGDLQRAAWTDAVSDSFGRIKAQLERRGARLEDFDLAIAAHAVAHDATLVSADTDHMRRIDNLTLEDWSP